MKKILSLCIFAALFASNAFAGNTKVQCGDTNEAYVKMDLDEAFTNKYLNQEQLNQYSNEGYDYMIAGRNCGLDTWESNTRFQVLFLFEGKKAREVFDLGPFSQFDATFTLNIDLKQLQNDDLVLTGDKESFGSRKIKNADNSVSGTLDSKRGAGKVKMIISNDHSY
ncbi:hypothetical protein SHI21_03055 [Bacteriovorax sp. PP10]|uniref:Uncharacterized protein n=1 Tax=Bacteriovorax antarcticus TaxID=3088717 RepID=A0ABU5VQ45_9BACT|nr:hypothetical protein [Bacteriovorax sp. PP10]MEA9355159.1 hypothetical protein [Bacteriovorax sp. PP10]